MADTDGNIVRSSRNLSLSVLASRILGFLRDMMTSAVVGGGIFMSAWVLASTLANIFRRILGEGALGQALVPILADKYEKAGPQAARAGFTTIFIYLTLLLCLLTLLIAVPAWFLAPVLPAERWRLAARLTSIVMPYAVFICAVGVMTSFMNMRREYFLPSLTAIIQNLVMIAALYLLCPKFTGWGRVKCLAFSVLVSGVLEFLFMLALIRVRKMNLSFSASVFRDWGTIRETLIVALPGMCAAGAYQLSVVADRVIAGCIGDYAAAALYYTDRVALLPVGVFAVSFGTVALTELSHVWISGDRAKFISTMMFSMRALLFLTLPMAAFLFVFGKPVLSLLFHRGAFDDRALAETLFALRFYVFGIPAFVALKVSTAAFTSRKNMRTPFRAALVAITLNIVLNLLLMVPLRQGGIALATVISSFVNNAILIFLLRRELGTALPLRSFFLFLGKLAAAAVLPLIAAWPVFSSLSVLLAPHRPSGGQLFSIKTLFAFGFDLIPLVSAAIVYGVLLLVIAFGLKMPEAKSLVRRFLKIKK